MKKLMIAAAIVCAAAFAQAATVQWAIDGITPAEGPSVPSETYWTYCYFTSVSAGETPVWTTQAVLDMITAGTDPYGEGVEWGNYVSGATMSASTDDGESIAFDGSSASDEHPLVAHAYAIITDAADVADVAHYQIVDCGEVTLVSPGDLKFAYGHASAEGWQSVPEPTSGLLLLLGVAGLALRRRRA